VTVLLVLLGGAVGAPARYLVDLFVQRRHDSVFPWGTFTVNVVGSLLLGVVAGAVHAGDGPGWLLTLVGTGFCGALTTFSTFGFETVRLVEEGAMLAAVVNVAASVVVGLLACAGGWAAGAAVAAGWA
jgi:CrcB protein